MTDQRHGEPTHARQGDCGQHDHGMDWCTLFICLLQGFAGVYLVITDLGISTETVVTERSVAGIILVSTASIGIILEKIRVAILNRP